MTAHALEGDREHCLAQGMDDYISKPITRLALWSILSRWSGAAAGDGSTRKATASEAPQPGRSPDAPDLDPKQLAELEAAFEGDADGLFTEILAPYLAITAEQLREIDLALQKGDATSVSAIAHRLKGASLSLGFVGMGRHAQGLELGSRSGPGQVAALAVALQDEFRRVGEFVECRRAPARPARR
jgi:CheY-like chemotaxis protein